MVKPTNMLPYRSCGYTLLELLIVVMIILIFSGLLLAQYNSFNEQIKLKTEVQKLSGMLELARKKTVARNIPNTCVGGFNGYEVYIRSNGYDFSLCCAGICNRSPSLQSVNFAPNITTVFATLPYPIQFIPSFQGTTLGSDITVNIKNTAIPWINKCLQLSISKIGIVTMNDAFTSC